MMKLFVWDFHGVLEKDNEFAVQEIMNRVLPEFNVDKKATLQECINLYGKRWSDYFKYAAPEFTEDKIQLMVKRAIEIQVKEETPKKYIKPNEYSHEVLEKISNKGHMNIIMSNSSPSSLDFFLESVGILNSFDYKYGADGHRERYVENPKEVWLKNFLKRNKFDGIVVIDDSISGIEMGNKFGTTYHYRRDGKFGNSEANYKITDLREILKEV